MNDLSTRVRDYLDRKKPAQSTVVTPDVTSEVDTDEVDELKQSWIEFKESVRTPVRITKCILGVSAVILVLWAMAIVDIQNDCYLNKECREWIENR